MITGFAAGGVVGGAGLAAMLGANVGTTLIVQLLSFDLTSLAPILILAGVWMFRRYPPGRTRDLGRVFIGLGLLLLSLHQLVQLFEPFQSAPMLGMVLEALSTQPVVAVLLSAIFTWAALQRGRGGAGHVAGQPSHGGAARGLRAGAGRQPGHRHQSHDRGRHRR